ncbi:hypothetical protein EXS65_03260 [Candidatus Peribacteria bacterium]|nr:hypothetical protein [Candidatus Peribacteria bacterium]
MLRFGQKVFNQPALLESFDRVITSGHIDTSRDGCVTNARALADAVAKDYPTLKSALLQGIEGDHLLWEELRKDVAAEIKAVFDLFKQPVVEEKELDPWTQVVTTTQQQLPLRPLPQPIMTPPSGLPTGGQSGRKGKP